MATQADVDALTAQVSGLQTALAADVTNIETQIAKLQQQIANGQPVDLTNLQGAVQALSGTVASAGTIAPPPAPPSN